MDRVQAWALGQAGSGAMGTFANEATGFYSPGLLSPARSDVFFSTMQEPKRKRAIYLSTSASGEEKSRHRQARSRHGLPPRRG